MHHKFKTYLHQERVDPFQKHDFTNVRMSGYASQCMNIILVYYYYSFVHNYVL